MRKYSILSLLGLFENVTLFLNMIQDNVPSTSTASGSSSASKIEFSFYGDFEEDHSDIDDTKCMYIFADVHLLLVLLSMV